MIQINHFDLSESKIAISCNMFAVIILINYNLYPVKHFSQIDLLLIDSRAVKLKHFEDKVALIYSAFSTKVFFKLKLCISIIYVFC